MLIGRYSSFRHGALATCIGLRSGVRVRIDLPNGERRDTWRRFDMETVLDVDGSGLTVDYLGAVVSAEVFLHATTDAVLKDLSLVMSR